MAMPWNKKGAPAETPEASAETQDAAVVETAEPKTKKRKRNERLVSVVNESAPGAAIDLLKQNRNFELPQDDSWVVLLLATDSKEFGGLSQKQKGDEAKGSIIQLISSDQIQVVVTANMLEQEFLGIVPTTETLDRMSEYALLTEAGYFWAKLFSKDGGETLDVTPLSAATYTEAVAVAKGNKHLKDVVPEAWGHSGLPTGDQPTEAMAAVAADEPETEPEEAPVSDEEYAAGVNPDGEVHEEDPLGDAVAPEGVAPEDDGAVDYEAMAAEDDDDESLPFDDDANEDEDEGPDVLDDGLDEEGVESDEDNYARYVEANRDRVVDEDEVRNTIARRFLDGDLDLTVDLEPFETIFATDLAPVVMEVDDSATDWLGSQVAQLSRQANIQLEQLHRNNVDELRGLFAETMSLHAEKVIQSVSPDKEGTKYKSLLDSAKQDFSDLKKESSAESTRQRAELKKRFDEEAEERGDQARAHAVAQFRNANRPRFEQDVADVSAGIDRRNEERLDHDRKTIMDMRAREATTRMDLGASRTIERLIERQQEQREDVAELTKTLTDEIRVFIDENRKNDVARAETLADQLSRSNQLSEVKAEHDAQVERLQAENADRVRRLEAELEANGKTALAELEKRDNEWRYSVDLEKGRVESANATIATLNHQLSEVSVSTENQYKRQIDDLEAQRDSYSEAMDRSNRSHASWSKAVTLLVLLIGVVAIMLGVIIGWSWGGGGSSGAMIDVANGWFGTGAGGAGPGW